MIRQRVENVVGLSSALRIVVRMNPICAFTGILFEFAK